MLNWIVWNRTVLVIKMDLVLYNLQPWYVINNRQPWYAIKLNQTKKQTNKQTN